jgi:Domain of unknown function (DUF4389)
MAYPVIVTVQPALANRNRITTLFRFFLAIPHIILVGGAAIGSTIGTGSHSTVSLGGETGLLGAVAYFLAIVSWFTIVLLGTHIIGIRQFTTFFLRWRVRAIAYLMLLEDAYPPFGDDQYPASVEVVEPTGPRDRVTVGFRLILAIPQFIVLFFIMIGWCITTIVAWFLILFTGEYPAGLYEFGVGSLRWLIRLEAYVLLLVDEYPPFSLE